MAQVTRVMVEIESTGMFDNWPSDEVERLDIPATLEKFRALVEERIEADYPGVPHEVWMLPENQFSRRGVMLEYDDGNTSDSTDGRWGDAQSIQEDIGNLWMDGNLWAVEKG